mmetsp:Transcript_74615/g.125777  ORF Transcript_74615/g.125777 Transcript_74615/m.125777 type:complete len:201 (+) Transcript_74615:353-955(+)
MVVQKQRKLVGGGGLQIPLLLQQKGVVLRVNTQPLVIGHEHMLCGMGPHLDLLALQPNLQHKGIVFGIALALQYFNHLHCKAELGLHHQVRVAVVVHEGCVLIGARDAIDYKSPITLPEMPYIHPKPRGLPQHLSTHVHQELQVFCRLPILLQRIHDISIDVVLRRTRREVRRGLIPHDGAPGVQSPSVGKLPRPVARPR